MTEAPLEHCSRFDVLCDHRRILGRSPEALHSVTQTCPHHPQQSVLNPHAGHRQTACIRNISAPQRSQYTASTFGRLTVVAGVHGRVGESGDFGMSGL